MSQWPATKAKRGLAALNPLGWLPFRERSGSHLRLVHTQTGEGYTWAFHDGEEIGPAMLRRIAKQTGLKPDDL